MINVLVFPCGSEIGLEVNNALKYDKHINLYGLSSVSSHGKLVYKNYIEGISFIYEDTFIDELNEIICEKNIDVLVPAYDDVILFLSKHRDSIKCKLVTSSDNTCEICRSKKKTYDLLRKYDFVPRVYDVNTITKQNLPLFAKPDIGQGSQGIKKIEAIEDLESILVSNERYVVSELLPGTEYTIDCFTDTDGELIVSSMRERKRIKSGISVNSVAVKMPDEVKTIANIINREIEFIGVWFFQLKLDAEGKYKLLEIAPRVAGSMSTSRIRGFNFILNSIYQVMGYKIRAIPHLIDYVEVDRALSNKYVLDIHYNYIYVDFDDTIITNDGVNPILMAFLYQSINKGKKLILLTRHANEIFESLEKNKIAYSLFEDVIHLKDEEPKSNSIAHKDAILIDDSFRERYDVSEKCGIPVFDIDCIEALIDWR